MYYLPLELSNHMVSRFYSLQIYSLATYNYSFLTPQEFLTVKTPQMCYFTYSRI